MFIIPNLMEQHEPKRPRVWRRNAGPNHIHPCHSWSRPHGWDQTWPFPPGYHAHCSDDACANHSRNQPDFAPLSDTFHILQPLLSNLRDEQLETNECCKKESTHRCYDETWKETLNPFVSMLGSILKDGADRQNAKNEQMTGPKKWQHRVDCSGFTANNISVKLSEDQQSIIVKAAKEEKHSDGSLFRSNIEKRVLLPENIERQTLRCRILPRGVLLLEADPAEKQFIKSENKTDNKHDSKQERESEPKIRMKLLPNGGLLLEAMSELFKDANCFDERPQQTDQGKKKQTEQTGGGCISTTCKNPITTTEKSKSIPIMISEGDAGESSLKSEDHAGEKNVSESTSIKNVSNLSANDDLANTSVKMNENVVVDKASTADHLSDKSTSEPPVENKDASKLTVEETMADHEDVGVAGTKQLMHQIVNAVMNMAEGISSNDHTEDSEETVLLCPYDSDADAAKKCETEEFKDDAKPIMSDNGDDSFVLVTKTDLRGGETDEEHDIAESQLSSEDTRPEVREGENTEHSATQSPVEDFQVRLEMPCDCPESIAVTVDDTNRVLNVTATRQVMHGRTATSESVNKSINIPEKVDIAQLKCQFKDGMLSASAPYMTEEACTRVIPVVM